VSRAPRGYAFQESDPVRPTAEQANSESVLRTRLRHLAKDSEKKKEQGEGFNDHQALLTECTHTSAGGWDDGGYKESRSGMAKASIFRPNTDNSKHKGSVVNEHDASGCSLASGHEGYLSLAWKALLGQAASAVD